MWVRGSIIGRTRESYFKEKKEITSAFGWRVNSLWTSSFAKFHDMWALSTVDLLRTFGVKTWYSYLKQMFIARRWIISELLSTFIVFLLKSLSTWHSRYLNGEVVRAPASHGEGWWFKSSQKRPQLLSCGKWYLILLRAREWKSARVMLTTATSSVVADLGKYGH